MYNRKDTQDAKHTKVAYKSQCFETTTKVLRTKLLEGTVQKTQSTLEKATREITLNPETLKDLLIYLMWILIVAIKMSNFKI